MTSTTEMDAVQAAELEAKPWNPREFEGYARAYSGLDYRTDPATGRTVQNEFMQWHSDMQNAHALHPCVVMMVHAHRPKDVARLALEWAYVSNTDDTRVAYTRDAASGISDRQLITSVGKYLARHWPHVPDHIRRDVQAHFTPDQRVIVRTTPEMIRAVEDGPRSCMASAHGTILFQGNSVEMMRDWFRVPELYPAPDWTLHPYSSYRPDLGWSMAVRIATQGSVERIDGRALIYSGPEVEKPVFVRTYARNKKDPVAGWSETDFALHSWLERNGYVKVNHWPQGARMWAPPHSAGGTDRRLPYIDGEHRFIRVVDEENHIGVFTHEGEGTTGGYWGESTGGVIQQYRARTPRQLSLYEYAERYEYDEADCSLCEECGAPYLHEDGSFVGRREETYVCPSCVENNYMEVRGYADNSRGYQIYYVGESNAVIVVNQDYYIDENNPPDEVRCLEDGRFAEEDDTVYVESQDDYYLADDYRIVCDTNDNYQLKTDCVRTEDTDEWVLQEDAFQSGLGGIWFEHEENRDEHDAPEEPEAEPAETVEVSAQPEAVFELAA